MNKSAYETAKDWYINWLLEESDNPYGEISDLIDSLSEKKANELLIQFQEDMENNDKPVPSTLVL